MMSSLYKRATPPQARVLRIVEGAVKNAIDAHPEGQHGHNFARSVAKRAAGTLTAAWPDVLAAKPSDNVGGDTPLSRRQPSAQDHQRPGGERLRCSRRSPLVLLQTEIGILARTARKAGQTERLSALVDVLRLIARHA